MRRTAYYSPWRDPPASPGPRRDGEGLPESRHTIHLGRTQLGKTELRISEKAEGAGEKAEEGRKAEAPAGQGSNTFIGRATARGRRQRGRVATPGRAGSGHGDVPLRLESGHLE